MSVVATFIFTLYLVLPDIRVKKVILLTELR